MTPSEFCLWLRGYLEIERPDTIQYHQVETILDKLYEVKEPKFEEMELVAGELLQVNFPNGKEVFEELRPQIEEIVNKATNNIITRLSAPI